MSDIAHKPRMITSATFFGHSFALTYHCSLVWLALIVPETQVAVRVVVLMVIDEMIRVENGMMVMIR